LDADERREYLTYPQPTTLDESATTTMNSNTASRFSIIARIFLICLIASISSIVPFTPKTAYAAGSVWCVRASGGITSSPCKNKDAYTTIQDATDRAANQIDEVRIANGTYVGNQGELPVVLTTGKSITLRGGYENNNWITQGAASGTIIDGQGVRTGIRIQGQVAFFISNLTIENGGNTKINDIISGGSGITTNEGNSLLILSNVILTNNRAKSDGGGIYTSGEVIIRNSNITNNASENRGGGIYATRADIDGSTFVNNQGAWNGGGLSAVEAIISNSSFTTNSAPYGGGVYTLSQIIAINTDFIGNRASGNGGGLMQDFVAPARIDIFGGRFYNNTATGSGGGLLAWDTVVITGTQIISNSAGLQGGGLFQNIPSGFIQATDASFEHNSSVGDAGGLMAHGRVALLRTHITANRAQASGGGLVQDNGTTRIGQVSLLGNTIENNQATGSGGGIDIIGNGALTLLATRVVGNSAGLDGGGLANNPTTDGYPVALTLTGGSYEQNRAGRSGGGVYADRSLTLRSAQVMSNTATLNGGGIFTDGEETNLTGVLLGNNRAGTAGDQLYVYNTVVGNPVEDGQIKLINVTAASTLLAPHAAIQVQGNQANITLSNTIVVSHSIGIARASSSTLAGSYNDMFANSTDQTISATPTALSLTNPLNIEPRFNGLIAHDFHLAADSPLIDMGNPGGNYTGQLDMDGQAMPVGLGPEIGADEFYKYRNHLALARR
jgi:predicted outer membrane repeat protein